MKGKFLNLFEDDCRKRGSTFLSPQTPVKNSNLCDFLTITKNFIYIYIYKMNKKMNTHTKTIIVERVCRNVTQNLFLILFLISFLI